MTAEARKAAAAAAGTVGKLYEYNKKSLLAFIYPSLGIASNFGYNMGYLLEIYQKPPKQVTAPKQYQDAASGRAGALVQSGLAIWLGAYMGGFSRNMPKTVQLPTLVKK